MPLLLGAYNGNSADAIRAYTAWVGRAPDLNAIHTGEDVNGPQSAADNFLGSVGWSLDVAAPAGVLPHISVPLLWAGVTLEDAAAGKLTPQFVQVARTIAAHSSVKGKGPIFIRTGWEFNGPWMKWASKGKEAAFITAFRVFVAAFRSVSRDFLIVWCPNIGQDNPALSYPGDDVVDVIGMDFYTQPGQPADPIACWLYQRTMPFGLDWLVAFGKARGKPIAASEWGVDRDAFGPYIAAAFDWFRSVGVLYAIYWNSTAQQYSMSDGRYPKSAEVYRSLARVEGLSGPALAAPAGPPAADTLVLTVSGDAYKGDPAFTVSVDGKPIGGTLTTSAAYAKGKTQDVTLSGQFGPAPHTVVITFANDLYEWAPQNDRNLYVHAASLNGAPLVSKVPVPVACMGTGSTATFTTP